MTKLSLDADQVMRCSMLRSSNMLRSGQPLQSSCFLHTHLYSLCMNAVWTTLGCCAAAAALIG